jgi:hypothetical protein
MEDINPQLLQITGNKSNLTETSDLNVLTARLEALQKVISIQNDVISASKEQDLPKQDVVAILLQR